MALLASHCARRAPSRGAISWDFRSTRCLVVLSSWAFGLSGLTLGLSFSSSLFIAIFLYRFFTDSTNASPGAVTLLRSWSWSQIRRSWSWSAQIRSPVRARRCLVRPRFHCFLSEGHCLPDSPYFLQIFLTDSSTRPSRAIVVVHVVYTKDLQYDD